MAIRKIFVCLSLIGIILASVSFADNKYYEKALYTDEYGLSFYPDYRPSIGQTLTLRLRTFFPAEKVTLFSDREEKIPMSYREGHWWGRFTIPPDYQEGGHFFTVWIKYPLGRAPAGTPRWSKSVVWYQAYLEKEEAVAIQPSPPAPLPQGEGGPSPEAMVGEGNDSDELKLKGSQSISFRSRTLEGSLEGYSPGTMQTREETLRLNISGTTADTEIEASLFRTSAIGLTELGEKDEKISILLRRASTEAYLGDFTADFGEGEFTRLTRTLSGGRVKGDYGKWGFQALYSAPKGEQKYIRRYGDGTQGPYTLGSAPVVIDSERVSLDGQTLSRGNDYTIDYQAGTITFLNKIIDPKSVVQVYYDHRETAYSHSTYGLRGYFKPLETVKLGATYLNDSDQLAGAEEIRSSMSSEAFDPIGHHVIGADASVFSQNFSANAEGAYSYRDLNLLASGSSVEDGKAARLEFETNLGQLGLKGNLKRVSSTFTPVGEPYPKQDVTNYGGEVSLRPWRELALKYDHSYDHFRQSSVYYENLGRIFKAQYVPNSWPSLSYYQSELLESNDPVTGSQIERRIDRRSVESSYQAGFISANLKNAIERWENSSPSLEVTEYKRVGAGLATIGLEKISLSSNIELEERTPTARKKTYDLRAAINPTNNYNLSSSIQIVDDTVDGYTNVTDLSWRAEPGRAVKTDGKYTIASVVEDFSGSSEAVSKQSGSLSLDLRPLDLLRLRYQYRPNFTRIVRTDTLSYNDENSQVEINLIPNKYSLIGLIYKLNHNFNVDKSDYPNFTRKESSSDTESSLYTLKIAPWQVLSTEFNYFISHDNGETLNATSEYTANAGQDTKFEAIVRSSLSEDFAIDSRLTYEKVDEGTGEVVSNITNTRSITGSLKGTWNYTKNWTFSLTGAYSRMNDFILSQLTYTISPGFGFIFRLDDRFRLDFDYTHSKSYNGLSTEKNNYSLRSKYSLSEFVDFVLRVEQECSLSPDYKLTDISANLEITF